MSTRVLASTLAAAALLATSAFAQQTHKAPRTADDKPNINGIWQAMNTADWDLRAHAASQGPVLSLGAEFSVPPGVSVIDGDGTIPYLPAAAEQQKRNFANRLTLDPEVKCYLGGVPRSTYMPYPFQIIQSTHAMRSRMNTQSLCDLSIWLSRPRLRWIAGWAGPTGTGKATRWW